MIKENCWGCGCKIQSEDFYSDDEIIVVDGKYWCEDCYENPPHLDPEEIPEDTPSLDAPWWQHR